VFKEYVTGSFPSRMSSEGPQTTIRDVKETAKTAKAAIIPHRRNAPDMHREIPRRKGKKLAIIYRRYIGVPRYQSAQ
jgi:hypothetical protein